MSRMFRITLLLGMLFLLCSGNALAQQVQGKFTLPFSASWGTAHLPPGEYTFTLEPHFGLQGFQLTNKNGNYFVLYSSADDMIGSENSKLLVLPVGTRRMVHLFYVACLHKVFYFNVPVRYRVDTKIIAQSDSPPTLGETIPVVTFGK